MYLGIEIGGTKLQIGVGADDGQLAGLWRGGVDVAAGPEGIRRQIATAVPELLQQAGIERSRLRGVGIGFGGPVDDTTRRIIKSHQIEGWNDFPLADWISELVGLPAALGNDADVAGLAEALHGAGKGSSPIFYITVGSGIGGGLIINGEIYRGVGRGAAEIGHLRMAGIDECNELAFCDRPLEHLASGWGIQNEVSRLAQYGSEYDAGFLNSLADGNPRQITAGIVAQAAKCGDNLARFVLYKAIDHLAEGICHVIALLCPRRIVIGGGVALMGDELFFRPLRESVAKKVFRPFAALTDIVPAALGEEVVVHGAIALARQRLHP